MCWAPNGTIFMGKNDQLYSFNPSVDADWKLVTYNKSKIFTQDNNPLKSITRITINPTGNKIAVVVEQ